jgi:hypothetical protein
LGIVTGLNNGVESWLERGSSNEETIDVLHSNELGGVGVGNGSTVKNSN